MTDLWGPVDAYSHNGDAKALAALGLRTHDFGRDWTYLGTVVHQPAETENRYNALTGPKPETTIKVEVMALPAQCWRFTITTPRDETVDDPNVEYGFRAVYEPCMVYEIRTGSGGFNEYWPVATAIADHMVLIKRLDRFDDEV